MRSANEIDNLRARGSEYIEDVAGERTLSLVRRLIEKVENQLDGAEAKGSIADFVKLLQLQKDLEDKRVRRIEVKWVNTD